MDLLPMFILLGIPLLLLIWTIATYNALVRLKNLISESWAGIDTELQRRHDLIPNLVAVVKGYASHEQSVFEAVTRARSRVTDPGVSSAEDENRLARATREMLGLVEDYPALKADRHFLQLQKELVNTEDRIQAARRFYNANVRDLNTRIEVFPSSLIAGACGFQRAQYYEVESAVASPAPVQF
jgi:LemA protein